MLTLTDETIPVKVQRTGSTARASHMTVHVGIWYGEDGIPRLGIASRPNGDPYRVYSVGLVREAGPERSRDMFTVQLASGAEVPDPAEWSLALDRLAVTATSSR